MSYHPDGSYYYNNTEQRLQIDFSDYSEISTYQFLEHVYKPFKANQKQEIKQEEKMRTITWNQGQEIIDMVCSDWKAKLSNMWALKIVLKEQIEVSEELLQQGRKEASQSQKEVIDRIFGKEKEEIDLYSETGIDGAELFIKNGGGKDSLLAVRSYGEYKSVSFYLNSYFNWEIKKDNQGDLCLIPTHKE
jgi:hypothetical protein